MPKWKYGKENIKKFQLSNISQPEEFSEDIKYDAPGMKREDICKLLKSNGQSYSLHTKWL